MTSSGTRLLRLAVCLLIACLSAGARVKTGLDVLIEQNFAPFQGKRVGIITNQTGRTEDGRRIIDVLAHAPGVRLTAIFSPEHGVEGVRQDRNIGDGVDVATGVPVYSLYNEGKYRPTPEMLKDVDVLVYDVHQNGARFLTRITTLGYTMEAAAEKHIPFYVLDRPNGINGVDFGGPRLDPKYVSFVGYLPGLPIRHGMTAGELAGMYNGEKKLGVDLHVIRMEGWKRSMWYDETGLEWVNPSPNIRNLTQAILYPGMCLLESKEVSVGRGTDTPFQMFGAPWYRSREVAEYLNQRVPGVRFVPRPFTPNASVYKDQKCEGVDVTLVNRDVFDPMLLGMELLAATLKFHPGKFDVGGITRLLGNDEAAERLKRGEGGRQVLDAMRGQVEEFARIRAKYLLYEGTAQAQAQNPSPMVEHARTHPRLEQKAPEGRREKLALGTLFIPAKLKLKSPAPLLFFFHGSTWVPEVAAAQNGDTAVVSIQIGAGSRVYVQPFLDPKFFGNLLEEAESKAGVKFRPITLAGWSAGCGAVRQIMSTPEYYDRIANAILIDGIHTSYATGQPGPLEPQINADQLQIFVKMARDAIAGKRRVIITHSEIFPGTYASTTETADYILSQLGLRRSPVVKWGPMGTQELSEARAGGFLLIGFAGNSAPDHLDQLHSLPEYLKWLQPVTSAPVHQAAAQPAQFAPAFQAVQKWIDEKAFPGAVLAVGQHGKLVVLKSFGKMTYDAGAAAMPPDAIFDLASCSKVVGCTTAAAILYDRKQLDLDAPVVKYLPEFAGVPGHEAVLVRHLLSHSSGLDSRNGVLWKAATDRAGIMKLLYALPLAWNPGERAQYRDYNMMLLGEIVQRISGQPLDRFLAKNAFGPLGMRDTGYNPRAKLIRRIAPTEQDDVLRHKLVRGVVHDENAFLMGGVAGHAGLFSTARDLSTFAQMYLDGGMRKGKRIISADTIKLFMARQSTPPGATRALGWDTPASGSFPGDLASSRAIMHTGFTGTSVYIDPERDAFVILLSNRVYPTRNNDGIVKARPDIHTAILTALDEMNR